jgi:DNA primase
VIPTGFIQDLLSRVDIVEVIGRHVELKRGGANLMGLCPFHAEKSPSFSVSPGKQFFHCFGCGASGDAIRFLTEHLGLSFVEAVRDLAQQTGLKVPEEQVSPDEQVAREKLRERRVTLGELLTRAGEHYRGQLRAQPRAIDYLKRRGLTGAVAARFGLGYAPPGWRGLASVFARYDDPLLEEAGLVRQRDHDGAADTAANEPADRGRYDWFRDRIMFPIRSVQGEVIGFGGRVLDDSKPKYINSPETPLFSKGRELYGLFEARQALREKGYALVVEGYMDVVALAQNGLPNAVATLGTACTAEHVQKLFRFTDSVVFSFDGDAAGRRAAARALEAALPHASDLRTVRFLFLPPEHDPDSYIREHGQDAFEAAVAQAVPLSRQLIELSRDGADLASAEGRARLLAQARPLWAMLPDGVLKQQMLGELARAASWATDELRQAWSAQAASAPRERAAAAPPAPYRPRGSGGRTAPAGSADLALRLLLRHADWWDKLSADDQQLLHELGGEHGAAVGWLEQQITEHGPLPWAALDEALAGHELQAATRRWVPAASADEEHVFDDLRSVVLQLWIERRKREATALSADGRTDAEQLARIRAVHQELQRLAAEQAGLARPA